MRFINIYRGKNNNSNNNNKKGKLRIAKAIVWGIDFVIVP